MATEIARILLGGDDHLCSKNRGCHNNYAEESLMYYDYINSVIKSLGCTHYIGGGDLTYGRFHTLEYRNLVEKAIKERNEVLNRNYYMVKGNHDIASYGMTEYEFYLSKGEFRPSQLLQIGNVNINMVDYGDWDKTKVLVEPNKQNVLVTHGYFKFKDTMLPNYGDALILDEYSPWFGLDYIICGHIHNEHIFSGNIYHDGKARSTQVHYLPCLSRPDYVEGKTSSKGSLVVLRIFDTIDMVYERVEVDLIPMEKSFNLALREREMSHKEATKVDVSDVVESLNGFERVMGSPEEIIRSRTDIDEKYRNKAIELLKGALA